jgi:uncharacterized Zn finger protein
MTTQLTTDQIRRRIDGIITRGSAIRILIDTAEPRRRQRAEGIEVASAVETADTGQLHATVRSARERGTSYAVVISGPVRGRIRSARCSCRDSKKGHVCKHAIAVALRFIDRKREEYVLLRDRLSELEAGGVQ